MGQEIPTTRFSAEDYQRFHAALKAETQQLRTWCKEGRFSNRRAVIGLEMEAWLIDKTYQAAPRNDQFLATLNDPLVVAELAKFNFELNVAPQPIGGLGLRTLHRELDEVWQRCVTCAEQMDSRAMLVGILPTIQESDLVLKNMSSMKRYEVLNKQVMHARRGRPIKLDIHGHEHLHTVHYDVMFESAATSFQLHLQVPLAQAKAFFNAAIIASAPLVGISANSPYFFGKALWEETRIPLFEQAVDSGGYDGASQGPVKRVTFGSSYIRDCISECFVENLEHYPVLIPINYTEQLDKFPHLRFHNGTIWRWNRPLVGFDDDGTPHFRIEHRPIAAGPTNIDEIANAAFYYGLVNWLCAQSTPAEMRLPFSDAKSNFYDAARLGLHAQLVWLNQNKINLRTLVLDQLLPAAESGLKQFGVDPDDIQRYLGIIDARVRSGRTGSAWQKAFVKKHQASMASLAAHYLENQRTGLPVHHWPI